MLKCVKLTQCTLTKGHSGADWHFGRAGDGISQAPKPLPPFSGGQVKAGLENACTVGPWTGHSGRSRLPVEC